MMKRIFTLIASIVLATSLLAVPCFAAEPEDLPTPQPGVTETEQPDGSDQPENPDRPSIAADSRFQLLFYFGQHQSKQAQSD